MPRWNLCYHKESILIPKHRIKLLVLDMSINTPLTMFHMTCGYEFKNDVDFSNVLLAINQLIGTKVRFKGVALSRTALHITEQA